ncbi:MAG: hypothetical protein ABSB78_12115 [Bacteroidota bacterium]
MIDRDNKKWKDHLLHSSIPLEFEVVKYLNSKGAIADFEYSYLKNDENRTIKEFSYDIDASYVFGNNYVDLMIECKYRHRSTDWVFVPESYGGPSEIYPNAFLHPNDHFYRGLKFQYGGLFPKEFGPLCSKGIEIATTGDNSKSINQAIAQLSYAFSEKFIDGMIHQVDNLLGGEVIFYHIPIITTTANLYRLRADIGISAIEKADDIRSVADSYDCLVLRNRIGVELRNHNQAVFQKFQNSYPADVLKQKLNSFNESLDFVFSVIANEYCPQVIIVLRHTSDCRSLDSLFNYLKDIFAPSNELKEAIQKQRTEIEQMSLKFSAKE